MKIKARIDRMVNTGNVKAIASVSLDGMFVVKNLKVMDGKKGLFVSMPQESYSGKDGQKKYSNTFFALTNSAKLALQEAKLDETAGIYYVTDHVADKKDAARFVPVSGDGKGKNIVKGLEDDEYTITEIKTADGYTLLKNAITVVITRNEGSASATVDGNQVNMLTDSGSANALAPLSVVNTSGFDLPATGDRGVWICGLAGILLMAGSAACIVITTRKKSK